jgi:hypothetical protein
MLTLDISLYFDDPIKPDVHEDGRPWHLHSSALKLLRLAKVLRDRVARAARRDSAMPVALEVVDMDGSRRDIAIDLLIVEGLKELPEWEFDLPALEEAFRKIDEVAVPAYQEQERAKLRALVDEPVALEEKRDAAQPS